MTHELSPTDPQLPAHFSEFPRLEADLADYRAAWNLFMHEHTLYNPDGTLATRPPEGYRKFSDTLTSTQPYQFFYMQHANYRDFGVNMSYYYNQHHRDKPYLGSVAMCAPLADAERGDAVYNHQAQQMISRLDDMKRQEHRHPAYKYLGDALEGWVRHPAEGHVASLSAQSIEALRAVVPAEKITDFTTAGFMTGQIARILTHIEVFGLPHSMPAHIGPTKAELDEWGLYEASRAEGHRPFTLPDMMGMIAMQNVRDFRAVEPDEPKWQQLEDSIRQLPAAN